MANKKIWLVMLAITLVFGFTVVGCIDDNSDDEKQLPNNDGTWICEEEGYQLLINGSEIIVKDFIQDDEGKKEETNFLKGSISFDKNGDIEFEITEVSKEWLDEQNLTDTLYTTCNSLNDNCKQKLILSKSWYTQNEIIELFKKYFNDVFDDIELTDEGISDFLNGKGKDLNITEDDNITTVAALIDYLVQPYSDTFDENLSTYFISGKVDFKINDEGKSTITIIFGEKELIFVKQEK